MARLSLEWEEGLYVGIRGLWRKFKHLRPTPRNPHEAELTDDFARHLSLVACAIAGRPLRVRAARGEGGVHRGVILLPAQMAAFPNLSTNRAAYLVRTVLSASIEDVEEDSASCAGAHLYRVAKSLEHLLTQWGTHSGFSEHWQTLCEVEAQRLAAMQANLKGPSLRLAQLELILLRQGPTGYWSALAEDPQSRTLVVANGPCSLLWGGALEAGDLELANEVADALASERKSDDEGINEVQGGRVDAVRRMLLDEEAPAPIPIHSFEKVDTLDDYRGGARKVDATDDLDDEQEALAELELRDVFRGGPQIQAVYKVDVDVPGEVPDVYSVEPGEKALLYDEWDAKAKRYHKDWVALYPTLCRQKDEAWGRDAAAQMRGQVQELARRLEARRTRDEVRKRNLDGDEIDIPAFVAEHADRCSGHHVDGKIYEISLRRQRDSAVGVLIDTSLSSGSYVENVRVLDATRRAVVLLGEVSSKLNDPLSIWSFASHTRNLCRVWEVKGLDDPWTLARARLGALKPQGYTRMGGPLRHAVAEMARLPMRHKVLFLLTDGKPTDYDRYEGRHGVCDVRMAVREAVAQGVIVHALVYDPSSRTRAPEMFGTGACEVVRHMHDVGNAVVRAYARRTGG
jgi:nitric oxide reductase NorD protein